MTLMEAFVSLHDPRNGPAQKHDLFEMIFVTLCAVLCGANTWVDIEEWTEDNIEWLRKYVALKAGAPSHDTFGRVFRILDAHVFEQCFRKWISSAVGPIDGIIAIDGKTVCGSKDGRNTALHMVSAYMTRSGLSLAQEGIRGKGNEIAAIKSLLEALTLKGCIVTIDAIGCQTDIAQKIIDRGGDYLLAVKGNQSTLADSLQEFFEDGLSNGFGKMPIGSSETVEKDHGRIETRKALWVNDLSWMDEQIRRHWPKLSGVGMLERKREVNGKVSVEFAFYIGSKGIKEAKSFAQAARDHWGIENGLHRTLDVTFREDNCRMRKGHAPQNLSAIRKLAFARLRLDNRFPKRSLRSRRLAADRRPEYRAALMGLCEKC